MTDQQDVVMDEQVVPQRDVAMDQGAAPQVEGDQQRAAAPAKDAVAAQQREIFASFGYFNNHHLHLYCPEWKQVMNNSDRYYYALRLAMKAMPVSRGGEPYMYRLIDLIMYSKEVEKDCFDGAATFLEYNQRVIDKLRELQASRENKEEYYQLAVQATINRAPVAQAAPAEVRACKNKKKKKNRAALYKDLNQLSAILDKN